MPNQIREQLNKLIQTHNGDEAAGKTLWITTQITKSLQQLVDAESVSIGSINAKQSTNCWTIFTKEVSTEGLIYGHCC